LCESNLFCSKVEVGVVLSHKWSTKDDTLSCSSSRTDHHLALQAANVIHKVRSGGDIIRYATKRKDNVREKLTVLGKVVGALRAGAIAVWWSWCCYVTKAGHFRQEIN